MAHRFAKVLEEEIEETFFYPSDLLNTKTTIPLRVGEEQWILYWDAKRRGIIYIHQYLKFRPKAYSLMQLTEKAIPLMYRFLAGSCVNIAVNTVEPAGKASFV